MCNGSKGVYIQYQIRYGLEWRAIGNRGSNQETTSQLQMYVDSTVSGDGSKYGQLFEDVGTVWRVNEKQDCITMTYC